MINCSPVFVESSRHKDVPDENKFTNVSLVVVCNGTKPNGSIWVDNERKEINVIYGDVSILLG